jgi:LuxR family maltose regulon positive regulatory protein
MPTGGSPPSWLWAGKLAPPQSRVDTVPRSALLQRLARLPGGSLCLTLSPPGFGKTTFLAQWYEGLRQSQGGHCVAWLSLDEADREPNRLLTHLILALDAGGVGEPGLTLRARTQALDPDAMRNLAALLQTIERAAWPVTLFIDDLHRASSPEVDAVLLALLERGGGRVSLAVASRTRPGWPLARLRTRGLLHEVDAGDLVLSLAEVARLFGAGFDLAALSILHSRTEGWAVAIQLARLWLSRGSGTAERLKALSGQVADIADYLAEQVVESLDPACQDFLAETSVLERFSIELADAVRGRAASAALLQRLAPYDALVMPLDEGRTWFRYHLLLAEFLQTRLEPARSRAIHREAARWLARQGDWALAVSHALRAGDVALAVSFLQGAGGWQIVLRKGIPYTQSLLQQFDDITRRREPVLLLIQAYLHAKLGDEALSMELLRLAEAALAERPELRGAFNVIEALVYVYFDHLEDPGRWPVSSPAAAALAPDDLLGQATLLCTGVVTLLACGEMARAADVAALARARMQVAASPLGENYTLLHIAQAQAAAGLPAAARASIDEALRLADLNFGTDSSLKSLVGCFKGQHLYWEGRWPEAMPWLRDAALAIEGVDGWSDVFAALFETRWRMALRLAGVNEAVAVLDHAATVARQRRLQRLARLVGAWRVDLACQCNWIAQARHEAQAIALEPLWTATMAADEPGTAWRAAEALTLALARLQLLSGHARAAAEAAERGGRWLGRQGLALPALRVELMALLAQRRADGGGAAQADGGRLRRLLDRLAADGLLGLLLELGPAALALLPASDAAAPAPWKALASTLRGWQAHPPQLRADFSPKESAVLALLVQGESNKAIARALGVSENTVKFHLKHIFSKLEVDSRSAAISTALQRGMAGAPRLPM